MIETNTNTVSDCGTYGYGTFQAQKMNKDLKVQLDPLNLVLAYDRTVQKEKGLKNCGSDHFSYANDHTR